MRLEDIKEQAGEDLKFDQSEMGAESVRVSYLFTKYSSIYVNERLTLKSLESKFKTLRARKVKLARQLIPVAEITAEEKASFLLSGAMIKGPDFDTYIDDEPDVRELANKVAVQKEKVDFLKEILEHIRFRNNQIKNFIAWEAFKAGGHVP